MYFVDSAPVAIKLLQPGRVLLCMSGRLDILGGQFVAHLGEELGEVGVVADEGLAVLAQGNVLEVGVAEPGGLEVEGAQVLEVGQHVGGH